MKPIIISAPFGNYLSSEHATSTLGTYTLQNRAGAFRWWLFWRILRTLRWRPAMGGWTNKLGLPNPGIAHLERLDLHAPWQWTSSHIVSLHGFTPEEWIELIERVRRMQSRDMGLLPFLAYELNVSCVGGATRIISTNGVVRIRDASGPAEVMTEFGRALSADAKPRGVKPTLVVKTDTGGRLVASHDHRVKALDQDGRIAWRRVDQLAAGDYVLSRKGHGGLIPESRGESSSFWYAVGFLYGDGHLYKHGPLCWNVAENKAELSPKIESALTELGVEFSTRTRSPRDHFDGVKRSEDETPIIASAQKIRDLLPAYERKGRWRRHGVPESLWGKGVSQITAFLRGLFDTDGGISKNGSTIILTTKYLRLAREARSLLLLFGIVTKVGRRWCKPGKFNPDGAWSYSLRSLGPKSLVSFRDIVGFSLSRKARSLDAAIRKSERRLRDRVLGYRNATKIIQECVATSSRATGSMSLDSVAVAIRGAKAGRSGFISEAKLPGVIDRFRVLGCPDAVSGPLRDYVDNDWWFDKVKSVTPGKSIMTYDVIGSSTDSYVSSGIVSHNCPNVGHLSVPEDLFEKAVEALGADRVIVKLPPVSYWETFELAFKSGVRKFHATNTLPTPVGGLAGPTLKRISLDVVKRIKDARPEITVIGGGGIVKPTDIIEYKMAGASHFAVASALLNPIRLLRRETWLKNLALIAAPAS